MIKTERLVLRPFLTSDAPAVQAACNDLAVAKWLSKMPHPYTLADAHAFLERQKTALAITRNDELIGAIGSVGELGYWLKRSQWGQGFATEAAQAYLAHVFSTDRVIVKSGYFQGNDASKNVLTKLGFKPNGQRTIQTPIYQSVTQQDMVLSKSDWLKRRGLPIAAEDITLRPITLSDAPDLQRIAGNDDVARMLLAVTSPWAIEDVRRWIENRCVLGKGRWNLIIEHNGRPVGVVGIGGDPMSVFYFVEQSQWGQGIATRALRAILAHGFSKTSQDHVIADCFTDNPASMRVLEKVGFEKYGEDVGTSAARLEPAPLFLYRLTRTKFESLS